MPLALASAGIEARLQSCLKNAQTLLPLCRRLARRAAKQSATELSLLFRTILVFALGASDELGKFHLVQISNGLEHVEAGVLCPVLDPEHVGIIASDQSRYMLISPLAGYAQFSDHGPKRPFRRIASAF